jgi:hypothetical protein
MKTCNYMTYATGPLAACGKPATHRTVKPIGKSGHRFYCKDCNAVVGKHGGIPTQPLPAKELLEAANAAIHTPAIKR